MLPKNVWEVMVRLQGRNEIRSDLREREQDNSKKYISFSESLVPLSQGARPTSA